MNQKPTNKVLSLVFAVVLLLTASWEPAKSAGDERIGRVALNVAALKNVNTLFKQVTIATPAKQNSLESVSKTVRNYSLLNLNQAGMKEILVSKPQNISLSIPSKQGIIYLELYKVDISSNGFTLITSDGKQLEQPNTIVHYRGIVANDMYSVVSLSVSNEETMGLICTTKGNFVFGKLEGNNGGLYVLYNDKDMVVPFTFECGANTSTQVLPYSQGNGISTFSNKCVNWYYETDYDIFVGKGSLANVNSYIQGAFNQVATLDNNDGISVTLQTLFVWTTADPYSGPGTSDYLNQFGAYRTSFAGDVANLVGYAGGGGVAYVNGLCASQNQYKMGYTGINSSYNSVPTYSWTVEVLTHEDGHLLGSKHTHDCVWNGNNTRIDGCGPAAGYNTGTCAAGPIPSGGGTIMSYCHLISAGINFNLGFGPQPASLILNNVNNSSCLTACSTCTPPAQPGTISGNNIPCSSSSQVYSVASVPGATSYSWTLPSGWSGTSTTNSINITAGSVSGNITVIANNSCGSSISRTLAVTTNNIPTQPGSISGSTTVCQGLTQIYAVAAVPGATSYIWTLPSGWTGTSVTNSITVTIGSSGGNISVIASNSCGSSAVRSLTVVMGAVPAQPGTISGNTIVCPGVQQTYAIASVSGASAYNWILPSGWTGSSSTTNIIVVPGSTGGNITITATNGCGTSASRTLAVNITSTPVTPSLITGATKGVCNASGVPYSVSNLTGIIYNWTFNTVGATVVSGQGSNSILVNFTQGYVSGILSVTAGNSCGTSTARSLTVKATLATPGSISGASSVCANQQGVPYSISPVTGASSYTWTVPAGARIVAGSVTSAGTTLTTTATSVFVNWLTTSGSVKVKANNACGSGSNRSKTVGFTCRETSNVSDLFPLTVYPNPVRDELHIQFESLNDNTALILLTDITGKTILHQNTSAIKGINTVKLNIEKISPGLYLMQVIQGARKEFIKVSVN